MGLNDTLTLQKGHRKNLFPSIPCVPWFISLTTTEETERHGRNLFRAFRGYSLLLPRKKRKDTEETFSVSSVYSVVILFYYHGRNGMTRKKPFSVHSVHSVVLLFSNHGRNGKTRKESFSVSSVCSVVHPYHLREERRTHLKTRNQVKICTHSAFLVDNPSLTIHRLTSVLQPTSSACPTKNLCSTTSY